MEPYACVVAIDAAGRIQCGPTTKCLTRCASSSPTRWGSLKTRSSSTPVHRRRLRRQVARHERAPGLFPVPPLGTTRQNDHELHRGVDGGNPRHPAVVTIKTGVKSDGTFWARHSTVVYNGGAYSGFRAAPDSPAAGTRPGGSTTSPIFRSTATWCTRTTCPAAPIARRDSPRWCSRWSPTRT